MSVVSDPPQWGKIWLKSNFYDEKKTVMYHHEPNSAHKFLKAHTFDSMNDRFGFAEVRWLLWASLLTCGGCLEMPSWYR